MMMRSLILSAFVLACSQLHAAPIKVYIFAGQSNAGVLPAGYAPPPLDEPLASRYQYQFQLHGTNARISTNWEDLRPFAWGSELSFGKAMEERSGAPVAIIKVAATGTALWKDWLPTANNTYVWEPPNPFPNLYQWMLAKVNTSLSQLGPLGYEPDVSGFMWIQGEADSNQLDKALAYDDNLATLASAIRTDLAAPDLPFVLNELHEDLNRTYVLQMRESQRNAAGLDPNMTVVNADDLALGDDIVHFTTETHIELGRRFADVFLPSGDYDDDGIVSGADLDVWKSSVGAARGGDGNADGLSDGADMLLWQRTLGSGVAPQIAAASAIPEPRGAILAVAGLLMSVRMRQQR